MKWSGTNEQRKNASKRVFEEDFKGFGTEETSGVISEAGASSGRIVNKAYERKADSSNIGRGDSGQLRGDSRPRKPSGIRSVIKEIEQLISEVKNDYFGK